MRQTILFFLFFTSTAFGQIESLKEEQFENRAYEIDKSLESNVKCQIDSINVEFSKFPGKIKASNNFRYSHTGVEIEYYLENEKPFLIIVKMFKPESEYYWRENRFYIENGKIFQEIEMFGQSSVMHGIGLRQEAIEDPYKFYHYNRKLTAEFFRSYIFELLEKIKKHH